MIKKVITITVFAVASATMAQAGSTTTNTIVTTVKNLENTAAGTNVAVHVNSYLQTTTNATATAAKSYIQTSTNAVATEVRSYLQNASTATNTAAAKVQQATNSVNNSISNGINNTLNKLKW